MGYLNWATIGTGVIANEFAMALRKKGRSIYSVANRTYAKGKEFAERYGITKVYASIDDVFADDDVDAVYISIPHNRHMEHILKALDAGKHVLCEKSITLNLSELDAATGLAERKNLVLAEAMTIYHMPLYKHLNRFIEENGLGRPNLMTINFGSYKEYDMGNRFFNRELAGGALLDIGVYSLSLARWFMSEKPDEISSQWVPAPSGVDEKAGILLKNTAGEMASIMLSLHSKQPKRAVISFDRGYLEIMEYPRSAEAVFTDAAGGHSEVISAGSSEDAIVYEIEDMEKAIAGEPGLMHLDYTRDVMEIMTRLRQSWGFLYPEEL